jgi:hypothetical protein
MLSKFVEIVLFNYWIKSNPWGNELHITANQLSIADNNYKIKICKPNYIHGNVPQ